MSLMTYQKQQWDGANRIFFGKPIFVSKNVVEMSDRIAKKNVGQVGKGVPLSCA